MRLDSSDMSCTLLWPSKPSDAGSLFAQENCTTAAQIHAELIEDFVDSQVKLPTVTV